MNRRRAWLVCGIAVVAVGMVGAIAWVSLMTDRPSADTASPVATASPNATPLPSPQEQAQSSLDEHLTACTASNGKSTRNQVPEHCGIRIPWGTEFASVTDVRFRVEALPVLVIAGDAFTAGGGVLVATVAGKGQDGSARTETYRTENWSVRGDIEKTGDVVSVEVW